MAQRLVLSAENGEIPVREIVKYAESAVLYGVGAESASFTVEDGVLRIAVRLPPDVRVVGKRAIKIKPRTPREQKIDAQIDEHKAKKKEGKDEGYVPPVGRNKPAPVRKIKCPSCGIRKQVVTVAGIKSIKPHVVKGESCPGSGEQVK